MPINDNPARFDLIGFLVLKYLIMKLLTEKQKHWMIYKSIKVGRAYMFPQLGFNVYSEPNIFRGGHMDTNPFTKSLAHTGYFVKDITDGFARVNFTDKPFNRDFYLRIEEIEVRDFIEICLLYLFCYVPMVIYNLIKKSL